jgi:hypothetical protein
VDITAPPKPLVQTILLINKMEEWEKKNDTSWEQVMDNLDLLFAQVGDNNTHQQKLQEHVNMSTKVVEQMIKDQ